MKSLILIFAIVVSGLSLGSSLETTFKKVSNILERRHKKASTAVVGVRRSKAIQGFFDGTSKDKVKDLKKIEKMSLHTHTKYKMDEMCVINDKGHEVARIVNNQIAPASDLSKEEASAPFFAPTFKLADKKVHIESPYMSPDSERFVIAYTTPVYVGDKIPALVHYEKYFGLYVDDIKRNFLSADFYALVVDESGYVWADTRKTLNYNIAEGKEEPSAYFQKADAELLAGIKKGGSGSYKSKKFFAGPFPALNMMLVIAEK